MRPYLKRSQCPKRQASTAASRNRKCKARSKTIRRGIPYHNQKPCGSTFDQRCRQNTARSQKNFLTKKHPRISLVTASFRTQSVSNRGRSVNPNPCSTYRTCLHRSVIANATTFNKSGSGNRKRNSGNRWLHRQIPARNNAWSSNCKDFRSGSFDWIGSLSYKKCTSVSTATSSKYRTKS